MEKMLVDLNDQEKEKILDEGELCLRETPFYSSLLQGALSELI